MIKLDNVLLPDLPHVIYTIRHGESIGNVHFKDDFSTLSVPNREFDVTPNGIIQSNLTADFIKENELFSPNVSICSSDYTRSIQIAKVVADILGSQQIHIDSRLGEWWKGIFHSMSPEQRRQFHPYEQDALDLEGWHHYSPPQGKSGREVEGDILSFFNSYSLNSSHSMDDPLVLCGHGRSQAFMKRLLTNMPIEKNCEYHPIPGNGEIWKFTKDGDYYAHESLFRPPKKNVIE